MTHITAPMSSAVGRQTSRRTSFPISKSDIRRWATAVYWPHRPPPIFWDGKYAASTGHAQIVAPEECNPFAWMVAHADKQRVPAAANDLDRVEHTGLAQSGYDDEETSRPITYDEVLPGAYQRDARLPAREPSGGEPKSPFT